MPPLESPSGVPGSVDLPAVEADKVELTLHDGVLTITIPKQAKALPRKIQIAA